MVDASLLLPGVGRTTTLRVVLEGAEVEAFEGETVAGLMLRLGQRAMRRTARHGAPRSYYCGMGACFECTVDVDGRAVQACLTYVAPGMRIAAADATAPAGTRAR